VTIADPVESHLQSLVAECDDPPPIDDLDAADLDTPCGRASIARAALCWWSEGQPAALAVLLAQELRVADHLAIWRTRQAWAEFENALREYRRGRRHIVSFDALQRRRHGVA
jgi:hypothetical protein